MYLWKYRRKDKKEPCNERNWAYNERKDGEHGNKQGTAGYKDSLNSAMYERDLAVKQKLKVYDASSGMSY